MERNDFITLSQKSRYTPRMFRDFLVSVLALGVIVLLLLTFLGYVDGVKFVDILLLKRYPWWIFYVIIFSAFFVLQQGKVELTIEPFSRVDIEKLIGYFEQKKFELEYRAGMIVKMRKSSTFDWLFGKDFDSVEIHFENNILKVIIAGKRVYDVSHAFRWTKDFLKD